MEVRVRFTDDVEPTLLGWLIKTYMETDYFHMAYYLPEVDEVWESAIKGVHCLPENEWLKEHKIVREYVFHVTPARFDEIRRFAISRIGAKYGFFQYLAIIFKTARDNGLRYTICSEFGCRSLNKELKLENDNTLDNITPEDACDIIEGLGYQNQIKS